MKIFFNILNKRFAKKRILFSGVSPTNFIQFLPVYRALRKDQRIGVFLSGMYQGKDRPQEIYRHFDVDKRFVIREKKAKGLHFDIYITPDFHLVGKKHRESVQMFHTTSFRNFSISREAKKFKHLFLIGPYMKRKFLELGVFEPSETRFEEIGMPQTDALLNEKDESLHERLGLSRDLPTILYAPVWGPVEGFLKDTRETLCELCSLKANLLVKMHHNFYYRELNKIDWTKYINMLLEKNKNMRIVEHFDIVPYMRISDLLVSDASAVVHQFSILDRPIVCMKIGLNEFYKAWPNLDCSAYGRRAVVEAPAGEALKQAVLNELKDPDRLSVKRQDMAKEYFYNIGSSTKCAVSALYRFLDMEPL